MVHLDLLFIGTHILDFLYTICYSFKLKLDLLNEIHFQISDPTWSPADKTWIFGEKPEKKQKTQKTSRPRGPRGLASSLIMRPAIDRPCTPKCPGM